MRSTYFTVLHLLTNLKILDIIFKFSTNWKNIYENDAAAQKAAGHGTSYIITPDSLELKGLMSLYKCNIKGLLNIEDFV